METTYSLENPWWQERREPVNLAMQIPITGDSQSPKPPKVRSSCILVSIAVLLRILGLAVAVVTIAYACWTFYQIPKFLTLEGIVKVVAQGMFLMFIGGLSLLAELRTRWTMRGCLSTYILFANYLGRGIVYIALGAILFALKYYDPPVVKQAWMAGGIVGVGVINILYYPFYWKHERKVEISKTQAIPMEPYPEEIIYGFDALYIKNNTTVPGPVLDSPSKMEGANEETDSKEGVTPGYLEKIDIVVEPAKVQPPTCAEETRQEPTFVENTVPNPPIGVGAS